MGSALEPGRHMDQSPGCVRCSPCRQQRYRRRLQIHDRGSGLLAERLYDHAVGSFKRFVLLARLLRITVRSHRDQRAPACDTQSANQVHARRPSGSRSIVYHAMMKRNVVTRDNLAPPNFHEARVNGVSLQEAIRAKSRQANHQSIRCP